MNEARLLLSLIPSLGSAFFIGGVIAESIHNGFTHNKRVRIYLLLANILLYIACVILSGHWNPFIG